MLLMTFLPRKSLPIKPNGEIGMLPESVKILSEKDMEKIS